MEPIKKCDALTTTGRRFKQDHTCTLKPNHSGDHYCNVCGHTWADEENKDA